MAKLSTAARKALPAKDFAGPGRSYPVEDRGRAIAAKSRASAAVNAGRMSKAEEARIDRKADAKLGRSEKNENRTADRVVARMSKPKPVK